MSVSCKRCSALFAVCMFVLLGQIGFSSLSIDLAKLLENEQEFASFRAAVYKVVEAKSLDLLIGMGVVWPLGWVVGLWGWGVTRQPCSGLRRSHGPG